MFLTLLLITLVGRSITQDTGGEVREQMLTICPGHLETLRDLISSNECDTKDRVSLNTGDITEEMAENLAQLLQQWEKKRGKKRRGRSAFPPDCVRRCTPSCKKVCTNNCFWDCDDDPCDWVYDDYWHEEDYDDCW